VRVGINAVVLGRCDAGVGAWTRGLIKGLSCLDDGNEYVVYCRREAGPLDGEDSPKMRVVRAAVPPGNRAFRIMWEQAVLPVLLRRDGVEVLHCPAYVMPVASAVATVATLHDLFAFTHPEFCRRLNVIHFRFAVPSTVKRARIIHCTSHWTRASLCLCFGSAAERARVVHPAVDDLFRPPEADDVRAYLEGHGLEQAPFLFVGNPEPKKNVPLLLEAFAMLKSKHGSERKLLLAGGEGWRRLHVGDRIRRLGLQGEVVRLGYVPREELPLLYGSALALVFPSVVEGFGLPPLEAMACGTPVITSGRAGLDESVGAAALKLREPNSERLTELMHELERDASLRARLRTAGLRRAAQFRWRRLAPQMVELYRQAAQQTS